MKKGIITGVGVGCHGLWLLFLRILREMICSVNEESVGTQDQCKGSRTILGKITWYCCVRPPACQSNESETSADCITSSFLGIHWGEHGRSVVDIGHLGRRVWPRTGSHGIRRMLIYTWAGLP